MTKQDFIQYLAHPENLNGRSIAALEKLVQQYPYFQTGRMLYLKNLHNENNIDYEKNLHITSAYAPSGKVLYNLIKKKAEDRKSNPEDKTIVIDTPSVVIPLPSAQKDKFDELMILEKEMMREAYRISMTVDLLKEKGAKDEGRETIEKHPPDPRPLSHSTQSYSFNDWLKVVCGKTPDTAKEEIAIQKKQKNQIIDSFILDETAKSMPKPKSEFYSAENMAKKSLQDDETFVTETLAKIYLKQGNLPKALRSYEILLVKHPEKFHIFAPLLEKIKNLLEAQKNK